MKLSVAKKAISLILLLGIGVGGVGVSAAHARRSQWRTYCWVDSDANGRVATNELHTWSSPQNCAKYSGQRVRVLIDAYGRIVNYSW